MNNRKPSSIPQPSVRTANLYRTPLPAYTVETDGAKVTVKACSATWWKPEEVPPRKKRVLDMAGTRFSGALERATTPVDDDEAEKEESEKVRVGEATIDRSSLKFVAALSEEDTAAMFAFNDIIAWTYLKGWGYVDAAGAPIPLPETPDDLLDLPRNVYDALQSAGAKIHATADKEDRFSVAAVEDPNSPTGASGD